MARKGPRPRRMVLPGDPSDPQGLLAHLEQYLEWLAVHGYSEETIKARRHYLGVLIVWLDERGVRRPVEVTKPMLERYQRHLYHYRKKGGQPLSFRSQFSQLLPVRRWFGWLTKENFLPSNPASELELPKLERRLPRAVLTAAEAERVLAVPDVGDVLGLRDRALLEVLYSTGIRRMELVNLTLYSLDAERQTLVVRQGKGKKDRMVPIGERALAWVAKYLGEARPRLVREPDNGVLFLTKEGEALGRPTLTQLVREYVSAAELGKSGSCHLFRHTMATLMLEHGADVRYIQAMLGHANLSTTELYTQVSIKELQRVHAATHPGANLERHRTSAEKVEQNAV